MTRLYSVLKHKSGIVDGSQGFFCMLSAMPGFIFIIWDFVTGASIATLFGVVLFLVLPVVTFFLIKNFKEKHFNNRPEWFMLLIRYHLTYKQYGKGSYNHNESDKSI